MIEQIKAFEMKLKHYIGVAGVWALVILSAVGLKACQNKQQEEIANTSLRAGVREKVIINPTKHTITVVTAKGTKTTHLPDRASSIEVLDTGVVKTKVPQFGYEQRPFVGYGFSNVWKLNIGCDLLYWKGFDIGPGVSFAPYHVFETMRLNALLSYTVYSNSRVGVSLDTTGMFGVFYSIRL